jgi:small GTP-binding protein
MSNMGPKTIRVALIGDTYVGKTTLLSRLFTDTYMPTEGPSQHWTAKTHTLSISDNLINLEAWDIPGAPAANSPDALSMAFFHAAIVCIDLENTYKTDISASLPFHLNSLRNSLVEAPIFVVGLKKDARQGFPTLRLTWLNEGSPIAKDTAERMARRIGAIEYLECSAKTGENVKQVFETIVKYVLQRRDEDDQRRRTASGRFGRRFSRMFGRDE